MSSEYRTNFRAFSEYSYTGDRFTPSADVTDSSSGARGQLVPWHNEVTELRKTANTYKIRGWGKETALPHLAQLYNTYENVLEKKIISALYLDNFQSDFLRRSRDRLTGTSSASSRQHSQPPLPQRNRPDKGSSRGDNQQRPKSAQNLHPTGGNVISSKEIAKTWKIKRSESAKHTDTTDSSQHKQTKKFILEQRRNQEVPKSSVKQEPIDKEKHRKQAKKENKCNGNQNKSKSDRNLSEEKSQTKKTNKFDDKKQSENENNKSVNKEAKKNIEKKKTEDNKSNQDQKITAGQIGKRVNETQNDKQIMDITRETNDETINEKSLCNGRNKSQSSTKPPLEPTKMRSIEQVSPTSSESLDFTVPLDSTKTLVITQNIPSENGGILNGTNIGSVANQREKVKEEGMSASIYCDDGDQNGTHLTESFIGLHRKINDDNEDQSQLDDLMKEFRAEEKNDVPKQEETPLQPNSDEIMVMNRKNSTAEEEQRHEVENTSQLQNIDKALPEVSTLVENYIHHPLNALDSSNLTSSFSFTSETNNKRDNPADSSSFTFSPASEPVDPQISGLPPVKFATQSLFNSSGVDATVTDKPAYRVI